MRQGCLVLVAVEGNEELSHVTPLARLLEREGCLLEKDSVLRREHSPALAVHKVHAHARCAARALDQMIQSRVGDLVLLGMLHFHLEDRKTRLLAQPKRFLAYLCGRGERHGEHLHADSSLSRSASSRTCRECVCTPSISCF